MVKQNNQTNETTKTDALKNSGRKNIFLVLGVVVIAALIVGIQIFNNSNKSNNEHSHGIVMGEPRAELNRESSVPLNVDAGSEIGFVYEAFPSPQQEAGEEEDTPPLTPEVFLSTERSVPREERDTKVHTILEFTKDLSRAYLYIELENVDPEEIVMLHLHCGVPGQLGPIMVDIGMIGDLQEYFADGKLSVEITNDDLETLVASASGFVDGFTVGCPVVVDNFADSLFTVVPYDRIVTIAGMESKARQGELYFNLHTAGQTYFGDARGTYYLVDKNEYVTISE